MFSSTFQTTHKLKPSIGDNIESLAPGRPGFNLELVIFKLISRIAFLRITRDITLKWIPQGITDN